MMDAYDILQARYAERSRELLRLQSEWEAMLANLTATQARCTEQEQRIRDQERELVELRGKQGAGGVNIGPFIHGWLDDVEQHDTLEQAIEGAKARAGAHPPSGKAFAGQVAFTRQVIPATAARVEDEDFACPF